MEYRNFDHPRNAEKIDLNAVPVWWTKHNLIPFCFYGKNQMKYSKILDHPKSTWKKDSKGRPIPVTGSAFVKQDAIGVVLMSLLLTLNIFYTLF